MKEKNYANIRKKLGIIKETIRFNVQGSNIVGAIKGNVNANMPKVNKFVSIDKEGNLLFWKSGDFDVTVSCDDVVNCKVVDSGKRGSMTSDSKRWYGSVFELTFSNGTTGLLTVHEFCVEQGEYRDATAADIPVVDGWLSADGTRDEHYSDNLCPDGYKPNILSYFKSCQCRSNLPKVDKALKLSQRSPETFKTDGEAKGAYIFDGTKSTRYIKISFYPHTFIKQKKRTTQNSSLFSLYCQHYRIYCFR